LWFDRHHATVSFPNMSHIEAKLQAPLVATNQWLSPQKQKMPVVVSQRRFVRAHLIIDLTCRSGGSSAKNLSPKLWPWKRYSATLQGCALKPHSRTNDSSRNTY
jgi:hypothetical protein